MSGVYVKRQLIRSEIRKAEIEGYIRKSRQRLLYSTDGQPKDQDLTSQELDSLYNDLEHRNYELTSLLQFIRTISLRRPRSLNSALLFVRLRYVLDYIDSDSSQEEASIARKLIKQICLGVVSEAVDAPSFLQNCFREFFQLLANHALQLEQIWANVALVRNQVFFRASLSCYIEYVRSYPHCVDQLVSLIVQTLLNFTHLDKQHSKVSLEINQYLEISNMLKILLKEYELDSTDLHQTTIIYSNIVKVHEPSEIGFELICVEEVVGFYIEAIEDYLKGNRKITEQTIRELLTFIGGSLGGETKQVKSILKKNPSIMKVFCSMLPITQSLTMVPMPRPVKWSHNNVMITIASMLPLSNLASLEDISYTLITNGLLRLVIELSAFPNSKVKQEVAIFIWNIIVSGKDLIGEVMCEHDFLYALDNILHAEHSQQALKRGLLSLKHILLMATQEENSQYWSFPRSRIKSTLIASNTYSVIERLCIQSGEISSLAEACLDLLG